MPSSKTSPTEKTESPAEPGSSVSKVDWGWDAQRREQLRAGLRMTPAQRLAWLEEANATMRKLVGLARRASAEKS